MDKADKGKTNTIWFHIYVESKTIKQMNKQNKRLKETDRRDGYQRIGSGEWVKKVKRNIVNNIANKFAW